MARDTNQLTLSFLDTTSLSAGGLTLDAGYSRPRTPPSPAEPPDDESALVSPSPPAIPARNFHLTGDRRLARGWKARAADNLASMRLALQIEEEKRNATPDEQEILSRFTGFGASELANALFRRAGETFAAGWEDIGDQLEQLLPRDALASLARSTQYAHYTPEFVIRAIWRAVQHMGFSGGPILEPGCGSGLFFALMPEALAGKTSLTGIEADASTARIAALLYPNAWIRHEDFTKARLPQTYALAIGNPPFSDRTVRADDPAGRLALSLHDYFIARSIERLKPGGLAAFVTSRWTMDKADQKAREHIASMADLIGAIRLPEGAMKAAAGTEVVADILFLQRRFPDDPRGGNPWDTLMEALPAEDGEPALSINRYFLEHPEMVLGRHARTSSPFGPAYTCLPHAQGGIEELLDGAVHRLPAGIQKPAIRANPGSPPDRSQTSRSAPPRKGPPLRKAATFSKTTRFSRSSMATPVPVAVRNGKGTDGIPAKHARIIRHLVPIRDALRDVLRAQENNDPWGPAQVRLRVAYASFVRNFGPINLTTISETADPDTGETRQTQRRPNLRPFAR